MRNISHNALIPAERRQQRIDCYLTLATLEEYADVTIGRGRYYYALAELNVPYTLAGLSDLRRNALNDLGH
jgi:hypothetical protein